MNHPYESYPGYVGLTTVSSKPGKQEKTSARDGEIAKE